MPPRKLTDFVEPTILPPPSKLAQRSNLTEPTMNNTPQLEVIKPMRRPRVSTLKVPTNLDTGPLSGGASHLMIGSGMSAPLLKQFIDYSYLGNTSIAPAGYDIDSPLSDSRVKVYAKKGSNDKDIVVTHRGSVGADDWLDNARYMVSGKVKGTKTYNLHRDRHKRAIDKYGASNIIAIGHSRAGLYLQELQKEFPIKENITYNKASGFTDIGRQNAENQTDVRVGNDVVSLLAPLQRRPNKIVKIEGTKNPFDFNAAHQTGEINKVGDQFIGLKEGGVIKRKRGRPRKVGGMQNNPLPPLTDAEIIAIIQQMNQTMPQQMRLIEPEALWSKVAQVRGQPNNQEIAELIEYSFDIRYVPPLNPPPPTPPRKKRKGGKIGKVGEGLCCSRLEALPPSQVMVNRGNVNTVNPDTIRIIQRANRGGVGEQWTIQPVPPPSASSSNRVPSPKKQGAKYKVTDVEMVGRGAGASVKPQIAQDEEDEEILDSEEHLEQLKAELVEVEKSIVNQEAELRTKIKGLYRVNRKINDHRRSAEYGKRRNTDDDEEGDDDIEFLMENRDVWQDEVNADKQVLADLKHDKSVLEQFIAKHSTVIGGNCGKGSGRKRKEGGFNNKQLTKVILDKNKVIGDLEEKAYGKDKFSNKQLTKIILDKNKVIGDLEETAYGGGTLPVISSVEGLKRLIATEQARLRKIKKGYKYESPTMSQEKIEEKIARLKERLKSAKANKGHADVSYFIPKSIKWLKIMAGETRVGSNAYNKLLLEAIKKLLDELSGKKPTAVNKKKTATLEEDRTNLEKIISPRPDANKPAPVIIPQSSLTNERASIRAAVQREKTYNKIVDDKQQEDIKVILKAMIPDQPSKEDQRKERAREAARRQRERDKPSGFTQAQQYNKSSKQRQTKAKQYGVPTREYTASIKRSEQIEQELERESDEDKKALIREERNKLRAKYTYLDEIMNSDNTDANRTNVASMGALPTIVEPEVEPPLAGSGMYGGSMCGGGSKYIITPKTEEYNLLN